MSANSSAGWVCTNCGAIASGETCMGCGKPRAIAEPFDAKPGSYWRMVGYPIDPLAARFYLAYIGIPLLAILVSAVVYSCRR